MSANEGRLNQKIVKALRKVPGLTVFKHADLVTAGVPDISITGYGATLWIEVKIADPEIKDREQQRRSMLQLSQAGRAVYVIYSPRIQRYALVYPHNIKIWEGNWVYQTPELSEVIVQLIALLRMKR